MNSISTWLVVYLTFVEAHELRVFCKAFVKEYKGLGLVFVLFSTLSRQASKKTGRYAKNPWRYIIERWNIILWKYHWKHFREEFLSDNTGPPGDEYRCYASFRFFKVPQKVPIRKPWMVLLVNKPAGSAFSDSSKIPKMVSINTFEKFRVCLQMKYAAFHV